MQRKSSERGNRRWEWPQAGFVFAERPVAARNAVQTAPQQQLGRTRPLRQPLVRRLSLPRLECGLPSSPLFVPPGAAVLSFLSPSALAGDRSVRSGPAWFSNALT